MFPMKHCSICGRVRDRKGRYCRLCHNAYMREWRKTHAPPAEEAAKSSTRSKTRYLVKKGRLKKGPCEVCTAPASRCEAHHPDYDRPELVVWLCRMHHKDLHLGRITLPATRRAGPLTAR
jgi:hypothetical protein